MCWAKPPPPASPSGTTNPHQQWDVERTMRNNGLAPSGVQQIFGGLCGLGHRIPPPPPLPFTPLFGGAWERGIVPSGVLNVQNAENETGNSKVPQKLKKIDPPPFGPHCPCCGGWSPDLRECGMPQEPPCIVHLLDWMSAGLL